MVTGGPILPHWVETRNEPLTLDKGHGNDANSQYMLRMDSRSPERRNRARTVPFLAFLFFSRGVPDLFTKSPDRLLWETNFIMWLMCSISASMFLSITLYRAYPRFLTNAYRDWQNETSPLVR